MGRRTDCTLDSRVRYVRENSGLSQGELARRAGISRQALNAIERGRYIPNTAVSLRLAHALGCLVEDLFAPVSWSPVIGEWASLPSGEAGRRVWAARIGGRVVAWPLTGRIAWEPADALITPTAKSGNPRLQLRVPPDHIDQTLLVAGCDPALGIAAALAQRASGKPVRWIPVSSEVALHHLGRGHVHIAGTHLPEPEASRVQRRTLRGMPAVTCAIARWVEGLLVAPGNPLQIHTPADLVRSRARIVNRDRGAGSRRVFDRWLSTGEIRPERLRGYAREVATHCAVAEAIANGLADVGPGVLPVARVYGLGFLPLEVQASRVVVSRDLLNLDVAQAFLDILSSRAFRHELDAIGGYDTSVGGR